MTLVLYPDAWPVRSQWALIEAEDVEEARALLGARERIPKARRRDRVGTWQNSSQDRIVGLEGWARAKQLDAVVWTALGFNFYEEGPSLADQVIGHLQSLVGPIRDEAERYIRRAPRQIDTEVRRGIEAKLQWTPIDADDV